jgi:hypothetical protein
MGRPRSEHLTRDREEDEGVLIRHPFNDSAENLSWERKHRQSIIEGMLLADSFLGGSSSCDGISDTSTSLLGDSGALS